jgi:hypothetical protein
MNETRLAVFLLVLGLLGLAHGGFDYFGEANAATSAPFQSGIENTGIYSVSFWLGCGALISSVLLLIVRASDEDLIR